MSRAERTSNVVAVRPPGTAAAATWWLDAVPHALLSLDAAARIQYLNRAAALCFGHDQHELLGEPLERLLTGPGRGLLTEHLSRARRDPAPHRMGSSGDLCVLRPDGSSQPVELELSHVTAPDGSACTLVSMSDIRERLQMDEELRRTRHDLEQLAYATSHELQEPLRMITSFLALLDRRYRGTLDERADRYIHFAVDGATRMQRMLHDLVTFSRVSTRAGPLLRVDTGRVVSAALGPLLRNVSASNAQVEVDELPHVLGDEPQLRQLFTQLLDNALKFHGPEPVRVRVSATREGSYVRICVQDNGQGLDMQQAERVFGLFERLHELGKYPGNGMGLALAKRIVERHAGTIWLESRPGGGTSVYFTLRAANEAT